MLIFVIAFNLSLTVLNLYAAYRLWRWRQYLTQLTLTIERIEGYCDRLLLPAPDRILNARSGSQLLRQYAPKVSLSLKQWQSLLGLIRFGIKFRSRRLQKFR